MEKVSYYIVLFVTLIVLYIGLSILLAYPAMILWNHVVPKVLGFESVSWSDMFYLVLLLRMIIPTSYNSGKK